MNSKIINIIPTLPSVPGIYFFKDANGQVIYIGKAKDLNRRVRSYFQKNSLDPKISLLIGEASSINYLVTRSEIEALLLEASVIAQEQPRFNVLLKDGQPFLYLHLSTNKKLPSLAIVRNKKSKGIYFGPFINKTEIRRVYNFIMKTFKLSICNKKLEHGCLKYHLNLCAGTCRPDFNANEYLFRLDLATKLLKGNHTTLMSSVNEQIKIYSEKLEFEKAQYLSEIISNLSGVIRTIKVHFDFKKFELDFFIKTAPFNHALHKNNFLSQELQGLLKLRVAPSSIDCFDISHFQSQSMVGSCIRFVDGIPDKNNFRRFKIRTIDKQNDYAALQEIVRRRYKNAKNIPQLIVVDGGKGQRNAVKNLFPETDCISLAKREERVFSEAYPEGVILDVKTNAGKTLIALRDYAHHFAISYHRKKTLTKHHNENDF